MWIPFAVIGGLILYFAIGFVIAIIVGKHYDAAHDDLVFLVLLWPMAAIVVIPLAIVAIPWMLVSRVLKRVLSSD